MLLRTSVTRTHNEFVEEGIRQSLSTTQARQRLSNETECHESDEKSENNKELKAPVEARTIDERSLQVARTNAKSTEFASVRP